MSRVLWPGFLGVPIVADATLPEGCIGMTQGNRIVVYRVTGDPEETVERVTDNVVRVVSWAEERRK